MTSETHIKGTQATCNYPDKSPGSFEVGLALGHAIYPKKCPDEYDAEKPWNVYGPPLQYFFTDSGKDLSLSKHVKSIGRKLGFNCELRARPEQGGIIERLFKTVNTQVLESLPGYQPSRPTKEQIEKAEKEACLTVDDLDKILEDFFFSDYNHKPYPKEPTETRYERWFRGCGGKLPEILDEQELDIYLMKEAQRSVQAHGTVSFKNLKYRCEELKPLRGKYVTLRYDPDYILTMFAYDQDDNFIGYAHAINMDMVDDLTLWELEQLNKEDNLGKRSHSNRDAILALDKKKNLVDERKQDKKQKQQAGQKKMRGKGRANSKVKDVRKAQQAKFPSPSETDNFLPDRIDPAQLQRDKRETTKLASNSSQPAEPQPDQKKDGGVRQRHKLIIPKHKKLKRPW